MVTLLSNLTVKYNHPDKYMITSYIKIIAKLIKWIIKKMLSDIKIEEYKKKKASNIQLNFEIKRSDKEDLYHIADKKGLYASELLRMLVKEYIKEQKKVGVI